MIQSNLKFILILLLSFTICQLNFAQVYNTSQSQFENFTVTDINGVEYDMYEILDEGKVIIINGFSVNCGTCWGFHQSMMMENLWLEFGPNGTDELFIMTIETNTYTPESELFGGGFGDWTAGMTHPIANADVAHLINDYGSFISMTLICPNRIKNRIFTMMLEDLPYPEILEHLPGCVPEAFQLDALNLDTYLPTWIPVCDNGMYFQPEITVQNSGLDTISHLVVETLVDDVPVSSKVINTNIATFDAQTFWLDSIYLVEPYSNVDIAIQEVNNNTSDDNPENNKRYHPIILQENEVLTNDSFLILIKPGWYAHELYWAVIDENNSIIAEGGNIEQVGLYGGGQLQSTPGNGYQSDSTYWETVHLPSEGCYEFIWVDDGGNSTPNGSLHCHLLAVDQSESYGYINGSRYISGDKRQIEYAKTTSVKTHTTSSFVISPNPVYARQLNLAFNIDQSTQAIFEMVDTNGRLVDQQELTIQNGSNEIKVSIPHLPEGLYLVRLNFDNQQLSQKIIVTR